MEAKVKVVKPGAADPVGEEGQEGRRRRSSPRRSSRSRSASDGPSGLQSTIQAGNDKAGGATIFKFFPANAAAKVGDTLTLQMPPSSSEVHSFTFGPSNGKDQYVDQIAQTLLGPVFNPIGVVPERAAGVGDGLRCRRCTATASGTRGCSTATTRRRCRAAPRSTFGQPGTYSYICLIHPFMRAQVTVNP